MPLPFFFYLIFSFYHTWDTLWFYAVFFLPACTAVYCLSLYTCYACTHACHRFLDDTMLFITTTVPVFCVCYLPFLPGSPGYCLPHLMPGWFAAFGLPPRFLFLPATVWAGFLPPLLPAAVPATTASPPFLRFSVYYYHTSYCYLHYISIVLRSEFYSRHMR